MSYEDLLKKKYVIEPALSNMKLPYFISLSFDE